jgi:hypothetical protein
VRLLAAALWREACCARPEKNRQVAKSAKQSRRGPCLQATKENLPEPLTGPCLGLRTDPLRSWRLRGLLFVGASRVKD